MRKILLFLSLTLLLPWGAFADKSEIIATFGRRGKITQQELNENYRQARYHLSTEEVTKENVFKNLLTKKLVLMRAGEIDMDDDKLYREAARDLMYRMTVAKELENEFSKIFVTPEMVKDFYQTHKEYHTAHILFHMEPNASPESTGAVKKFAKAIYEKEVKSHPKKFKKIMKKLSGSNSAISGADLGFQPPNAVAPEYYRAIKNQPPGAVVMAESQFGIFIIKVLGVKQYEEVTNKIPYINMITANLRNKIIDQYLDLLKKKYKFRKLRPIKK